jgi:hypothetical protein
VMAIMLSISLEFKMLQEGLAQMQNNVYRAYILKVGSIFFYMRHRVGLLLGLY